MFFSLSRLSDRESAPNDSFVVERRDADANAAGCAVLSTRLRTRPSGVLSVKRPRNGILNDDTRIVHELDAGVNTCVLVHRVREL